MLILARKPGQSIMIGDNIRITLLEIQGEQIRLGIDAPKEITVHRLEVYEEIARENKIALHTSPSKLDDIREMILGNEEKAEK
jgi:carbon storage regulator